MIMQTHNGAEELTLGDSVEIVSGIHAGKQGVINKLCPSSVRVEFSDGSFSIVLSERIKLLKMLKEDLPVNIIVEAIANEEDYVMAGCLGVVLKYRPKVERVQVSWLPDKSMEDYGDRNVWWTDMSNIRALDHGELFELLQNKLTLDQLKDKLTNVRNALA